MFKKILAAVATLLLGVGASFVAIAAPASAHTGDLNATAVCNTTTGQYDVTYTLTIASTSLAGTTYWRTGTTSFEGTPSSNAGLTSGPVASTGAGVYTLGTISLPGTSTQAPWAYAFTTWTDGYTKGSDGGDIALGGNCSIPNVPVAVLLTYMQDCPVDTTNTWRVRNPSALSIVISWHNASNTLSGTHTATPGDTFFTTPRGSETMIISWGGGSTGVVAGSTTKAAGNDLSATDPACLSPDPKVDYDLGKCYPNGAEPNRFSSKNLYIILDNTLSEVAVTFHVVGAADVTGPSPSADIVRTLAAGEKVTVETTPIWNQGGGYTVEFTSPGYTIPNAAIVVPAFVGCLDGNPGDPKSTNTQCVAGAFVGGSITVKLLEGFTYTITGPAGFEWISDDIATVTGLVPGTYVVTIDVADGYVLTGDTEWPYDVIIGGPANCVTNDAAAAIDTLPATCFVDGKVDPDPAKTSLTFASWTAALPTVPGSYTVVAAANAGHAFAGGLPTKSFDIVIQAKIPASNPACDLPVLATVYPKVSSTPLTCTAAGSYTIGALTAGTVKWSVNGGPLIDGGTFPVTATTTISLVASPTNPLDTLATDLTPPTWTNPVVLNFTKPATADCGLELTTLALTGAGSTVGLSLAGGLVLLGFGALLMIARKRREV